METGLMMLTEAAGLAGAENPRSNDVFDQYPFPALVIDGNGDIHHANATARALADRLDGGLGGLLPLYHATYLAEARKRPEATIVACTRAYDPKTVLQWSYRAGDGDDVAMFAADISGLSQFTDTLTASHDRLLRSETLLRRFIEHVPLAVAMFDREMRYLLTSRKWRQDFDFLPEDLEGRSHYQLIALPETSRARHASALAGEVSPPVEITYVRPDSGATEWLRTQALPWRRDDGEIGGVLLFAEIITARKIADADRERREVQQREQQRLEALGTLASGIAHEIGSPIQYISNNLGFLEGANADLMALIGTYRAAIEGAALSEAARRGIAEAEASIDLPFLRRECADAATQARSGVETISRIVSAVKTFAAPGTIDAGPTDINALIRDTILLCRTRWKPVAEIEADLEPTLPLVLAHADQLGQALLNILGNAMQAIADAERPGLIGIRTRDRGTYVEIRIEDNGIGIPEARIRRIFEPFFTTRAPGSGSGQGLAIAHAIITRAHGGEIECESVPDAFTRFTVSLPYRSPEAPPR